MSESIGLCFAAAVSAACFGGIFIAEEGKQSKEEETMEEEEEEEKVEKDENGREEETEEIEEAGELTEQLKEGESVNEDEGRASVAFESLLYGRRGNAEKKEEDEDEEEEEKKVKDAEGNEESNAGRAFEVETNGEREEVKLG